MYETIVIGGGPGAMSAILYLSRLGLKTAWIYGYGFGGQIQNTEVVDNYLGKGKIYAPILVKDMYSHVEDLEHITQIFGMAENVNKIDDSTFIVTTDMGEKISGNTVLVATGASPRKLGVKGEEDFAGFGVSYCAICDAPLFKDKEVAIVGGGQTALEDAQILSRHAKNVYLIHRRQEFRATKAEVKQAKNTPNIHFLLDTQVTSIMGKDDVDFIVINEKGIGHRTLSVDGIFIAIGQVPQTDFLTENFDYILRDGYVETMRNNKVEDLGIFAIGDVVYGNNKQIAIAVGEGANAAIEINKYLSDPNF